MVLFYFKIFQKGSENRGATICHHICLAWVVVDSKIIVFYKLQPSSMSKIEVWLGEDIFQALVVCKDLAAITNEVMAPIF